jgi:hypothetical protein
MKKLNYILILAFALAFAGCEDIEEKPTLDNENAVAPVLLTPAGGSTYALSASEARDDFDLFEWSAADYGVDIAINYTLQLDQAGGNFVSPRVLARTSDLTDTMTVSELNLMLFDLGYTNAQSADLDIRVLSSSLNPEVDTLYSQVNSFTVTSFSYGQPDIVAPADGSTFILENDTTGLVDFEEISWTSVNYYSETATRYRLEFDHPDNSFTDPATLYNGTEIQFTPKVLDLNNALLDHGYSAGEAAAVELLVTSSTDGSGAIQSGIVEYTITPYSSEAPPPEPLYLVGAATTVGWDNTAGLPIEWDAENGVHSITTELTAGGMKILQTLGQWAPQWGDDGNGDGTGGVLIYRPDEITTDPAEIPSPGDGTYRIDVDIPNLTYTITPV